MNGTFPAGTLVWLYALLPLAVALLGWTWTSLRPPGPRTVGAIQHFAAGVIFFAAAGELLPDALETGGLLSLLLGGGLGVLTMLALRRFSERRQGRSGLVAAAALDGVVDGLVLGLAFHAGVQQGSLLAVALAVEFLFLGLAVAGAFPQGTSRLRILATTAGIALAVIPGVALAQPLGSLPPDWRAAAFAFGLVALLYLVTEELLVEAHERPETSWGTASFFTGFLALAAIDQAMAGGY